MMTRREWLWAAAAAPLLARQDDLMMAGIPFRVIYGKKSNHNYLHIHGDEKTARQVLTETVQKRGGMGVLILSETRNVPILSGKIDPNRMFSREGAIRSLKTLNPDMLDFEVNKAADLLDKERHKFFDLMLPQKNGRIVALHNNANGYSVEAEIVASDKTSLKDSANPHEFFLCVDAGDFNVLAESPFNVVLQKTPAIADDGSLSRSCAKLGVRYINLECARGKLDRQREMMGWLEDHLG